MLSAVCCLVVAFAITGCGDAKPKNVAEGIQKSDVEKYEEMLANDNKAMTEDDAADE